MNKTILLTTLAIVLVAGCAQTPAQWPFIQITPTLIGGAGMPISDFSADQANVYGGTTDRIMMTVKNAGGFPVADDKSLVYLTGSAISLSGDDKIYWTGATETVIKHFGKTMNPADTNRGIEADEKTITWSLKAPNITKGQPRTDLFIGRVYYDYQTSVSGTIWIYSQSESDAARAAGRTLNKATFSSTSGPVALTVKVSPDPVVLATGETKFSMTIRVSSIGGGTLYKNGIIPYTTASTGDDLKLLDTQLNRVLISTSAPGLTIPIECSGEQELIGGKDITLSCDVTVSSPPATFQGYPVTITADYGYFTERTASVVVTGR